jgi:hypothetical protein
MTKIVAVIVMARYAAIQRAFMDCIPAFDDGAAGRLYESPCSLFALLKSSVIFL